MGALPPSGEPEEGAEVWRGLSDELRPFVDVECQLVELFMLAKIQIKNNNTKQQ